MTNTDLHSQQVSIARTAGIWYLLMAIGGILGFMTFQPQVYDSDPQQTLTNLIEGETLARIRLLLEFLIVVSQALTAIWFYRLFKPVNEWAALATAIWGTVNAVVILVSAISMGVALDLAQSTVITEGKEAIIFTLTGIISNTWGVGGLFFGLWLIPLGYILTSSRRMPPWLGRVLILGGVGYLISTVLSYAGISGSWKNFLVMPATIGEFWMIGYLLSFGIRQEEA